MTAENDCGKICISENLKSAIGLSNVLEGVKK